MHFYLNNDGKEDGKPSFSPQVVEDKTNQCIWRLKCAKKLLFSEIMKILIISSHFEWVYV